MKEEIDHYFINGEYFYKLDLNRVFIGTLGNLYSDYIFFIVENEKIGEILSNLEIGCISTTYGPTYVYCHDMDNLNPMYVTEKKILQISSEHDVLVMRNILTKFVVKISQSDLAKIRMYMSI